MCWIVSTVDWMMFKKLILGTDLIEGQVFVFFIKGFNFKIKSGCDSSSENVDDMKKRDEANS